MIFRAQTLLSIGECMVEMAPTPDGTYKMGFAGDTFNTAWYAQKMFPADWDVSYFTALGDDPASGEMLDFMNAADISTDHIQRIAGKTVGLYMIQLKDGERSFAYWRETSAARLLARDADRLNAAMQSAGIVYFSGITIAVLSAEDRETLCAALTQARADGCIIVFDPNLRPRLWSNTKTMCEAVTQAAKCADIVLPSFEDECAYFNDKTVEDTAARYRATGAGMVIVKNGEEEMYIWGATVGAQTYTPTKIIDVIDSTAAGDSFNAGFLSVLVAGGSIIDAVAAGAELSAKVITKRGALVEV